MNTMNKIIRGVLLSLIILPATLWAQTNYAIEGKILGYNNQTINLNDAEFRLLATTKVFLRNNIKGQLSDLKVGDYAQLSLIKIDKKRYVDTIQIVEQLEPNEINLTRE